MTDRPKIRLSRLRDIGWSLWDPIGLLDEGAAWDGAPFADEYDGYLLQAAGRVRRGAPEKDIIDYLVQIETEELGLSMRPGIWERAASVVEAIRSDKDLWREPSA